MEWGADYLHLTADDIIPGVGWALDALRVASEGAIPAGLVCEPDRNLLDPETDLPYEDNPLSGAVHYWEGDSGPDAVGDGSQATEAPGQYAAVPLCTNDQWRQIGPMIATHYGTDKWFSHRAALAGFSTVTCRSALFYHLVAQEGRIPSYDGWMHVDLLDYDLNIAYPQYASGSLAPGSLPSTRGTPGGRAEARAWRVAGVLDETVRPWDPTLEPDPQYH
jgi:GT2 family glycosyltransferase